MRGRVRRMRDRKMARRIERERGPRQPVRRTVIRTIGKPAGQRAEVGRAVAAPAAPLVQRGHGGQQQRNGGPCLGAQHFGLRRLCARADEPAAQALPALAPGLLAQHQCFCKVLRIARRGIARFALRGLPQQGFDVRCQRQDVPGDAARAGHQVADKTLQVVDQPLLVGHHRIGVGLLQLDAAADADHEGLCVVGQAFEHPHQVAQGFMHLGGVGLGQGGQGQQALQPVGDVFQCHRLQLGLAQQSLGKHPQCRLHRFAALRQAVQIAGAVEVAQVGDPRRVGLRFEVAPFGELRQCRLDFFDGGRDPGPMRLGLNFVRPQVQAKLAFGGGKSVHGVPVQRRLVGADMAKQLAGVSLHRAVKIGSASAADRTCLCTGDPRPGLRIAAVGRVEFDRTIRGSVGARWCAFMRKTRQGNDR